MPSTYEMIRALPGKGTDWPRLVCALSDHYVRVYAETTGGAEPWPGNTTAEWAKAKGVREMRFAAMCAANSAVHQASTRSGFLPPSPQTLAEGGFLGGEALVWTDEAAEQAATAEVARIIARAA